MRIGGIQKSSLVDYPGHVCAAIFTIGCNFRCGYCHNPELVLPDEYLDPLPTEDILRFLESRKGLLDGVAISGGEPTLQKDLPEFIEKCKDMGFLVKLDSNGSNPDMIEDLIQRKLVDYIAMDIKGPLKKYSSIMGWDIDTDIIRRSIDLIKKSKLPHEFRTTIVKSQLELDDFKKIGRLIKGAHQYALQKFKPNANMNNPAFKHETTYSEKELRQLQKMMEEKYVKKCVIH